MELRSRGFELVNAWKVLLKDKIPVSVRTNTSNLQKLNDQVRINGTQYDRLSAGLDEAPDAQKYIDELQPKKTKHDGPADDVNGPIADSPEQIDELAATDNPITDDAKKFWWNHEANVNSYLDDIYDEPIGRQITTDITLTTGETFTVRLDNIVADGLGYRIIDAKSSIRKNLSTQTVDQLRNGTTTTNQKKLYDAIASGTIQTAQPRGGRARQFFGAETNADIVPITFGKQIDFFVNDLPASEGYNLFRKTLSL